MTGITGVHLGGAVPQSELVAGTIESFPNDVIGVLCQNLPLSDIATLSWTSRRIGRVPQEILKKAWAEKRAEITLGAELWDELGVKIEAPVLPNDIDEILKAKCPIFKGKKTWETWKLVLFSDKSFTEIGDLTRHLKKGEEGREVETVFSEYSKPEAFQLCGDQPGEISWALVLTELVPDTLDKPFEEQRRLVEKHRGCQVPRAREVLTLVTMDKKRSGEKGKWLLPQHPRIFGSFTACQEGSAHLSVIVGSNSDKGVVVSRGLSGSSDSYEGVGMLAVRHLSYYPREVTRQRNSIFHSLEGWVILSCLCLQVFKTMRQ